MDMNIQKLDPYTIKFLINGGLFTETQLQELVKKTIENKKQLMTIRESMDLYLYEIGEKYPASTVYTYRQVAESFIKFFCKIDDIANIEDMILKDVEIGDIEKWLEYLASMYSTSRVAQFRSGLINYFNFLGKHGFILPDIKLIQNKKYELKEIEALRDDEIKQLIDNAPTCRSKAIICFVYETGIKHSELMNCKKSHIDFKNRTVDIYKGNKVDRIGYLSEDGAKLIQDYIEHWKDEVKEINEKRLTNAVVAKKVYKEVIISDYLFQTYFAERIGYATIDRDVNKAAREYYLRKGISEEEIENMQHMISTETIRNSRRAYLISEGKTAQQVLVLMGDDNITRNNRYLLVAQKLYPEKFKI